MIVFNVPPCGPASTEYVTEAIRAHRISGDGPFTQKCSVWIEEYTAVAKALLTTSCSHALDMAAVLCNIAPGDEVIMPSYTFSSTANAFVARGATIVFVDIRPDTMNMDEKQIEAAITSKTKAIVVMHYAGVACEMDAINAIAQAHGLLVVEDAAQGVLSTYKGRPLGALSNYGTFSFHETKNYSMGEGGAILIRDEADVERAEIIREKGTNRSKFFRGQVDKYSWVGWGSSYLPSEMNAAYLWGQLEVADQINRDRLASWDYYGEMLSPLVKAERLQLPTIPAHCVHNAHMFYIKTKDLAERTALQAYLKERDILAVYHYVPLHSAPAGRKYGRFCGQDRYTTAESDRLLRLPLYYQLARADAERVAEAVLAFYAER